MIEWQIQEGGKIIIVWTHDLQVGIRNYGLLLSPKLADYFPERVGVGLDKDSGALVLKPLGAEFINHRKLSKMSKHHYLKSLKLGQWLIRKGFKLNYNYTMVYDEELKQWISEDFNKEGATS